IVIIYSYVFYFIFIFYLQSEDGIRVFHVTGVQTCALPISGPTTVTRRGWNASVPATTPSSRSSPRSSHARLTSMTRASAEIGARVEGRGPKSPRLEPLAQSSRHSSFSSALVPQP